MLFGVYIEKRIISEDEVPPEILEEYNRKEEEINQAYASIFAEMSDK